MFDSKNTRLYVGFGLLSLFFLMSGVYVAHFRDLQRAGYEPTFLGSAISILDNLLLEPANINEGQNQAPAFEFPAPPAPGSITIVNTPALTKLGEGLFNSNPLYLYAGSRYNLRVSLGDEARPAMLKNYYVNFVNDGVVRTLDARIEAPVTDGAFNTRILTVANRVNGVLDVPAGQYDGYINMVWDTGTQTIRFNVTVLPARVVVVPTSIIVNETPVVPPVINPPAPVVVAPALFIQQLEVRDGNGITYSGVNSYQTQLWAYAKIFTTGNGAVYNLSLVSRSNSANQYGLASGSLEGSGTKELRAAMPALNNLPTGVYDLTLVAAPRLANGATGAFVTRREAITLVNESATPPVSIIVSAVNPAPTGDGNVTFPPGTVNLNATNYITNRACADGGDAVNYSVLALTQNTATLNQTPASGCLVAGDEVLLISLQGITAHLGNVGTYELFRVKAISGSTVTFTADKKRIYGDNGGDGNLGVGAGNHRVMLQRVPNYSAATINSGTTVIANSFNGVRGGVLAFRVNGTLTVNGKISMDGLGYRGGWVPGMQGEGRIGLGSTLAHCYDLNYYGNGSGANDIGGGAHHCYGSGAGGSNATAGGNGYGHAFAGSATSVSNANYLILGGGGGAAAGAVAGNGGGIILILAETVNSAGGGITASGAAAPGPCGVGTYTYGGGGGAGGSIYIKSPNLNIGSSVKADLGAGLACAYSGGNGGTGRVEFGSSL